MSSSINEILAGLNEVDFFREFPLFSPVLFPSSRCLRQYSGTLRQTRIYDGVKVFLEFDLTLTIPEDYPFSIPRVKIDKVYNTKGLIIKDHFFIDGSLCLGVLPEVYSILNNDYSLLNVMECLVIPFLAGLCLFFETGRYPYGERSHGFDGYREFFKEKYGLDNDDKIWDFLLITQKSVHEFSSSLCPFGCHVNYGVCCCHGSIGNLKRLFPRNIVNAIFSYYISEVKLTLSILGRYGYCEIMKRRYRNILIHTVVSKIYKNTNCVSFSRHTNK